MDEIRRQDMRLFAREALSPWRLVAYFVALALAYNVGRQWGVFDSQAYRFAITVPAFLIAASLYSAYSNSVRKRFRNPRMRALWEGCQDRLTRFDETVKRLNKHQQIELREMPNTIRKVGSSLYTALRRADNVAHEVQTSERGLYAQPPVWKAAPGDAQSKELYRLADKNIAEYRAHFAGVMAGVERTEAQAAVYMTTVDTLRMRMLGYRLVGNRPEMNSQDLLESLAEARTQLQAIDTALEELDLGHYPKMIAAVPPPPPEDIRLRLGE